MVAEGGGDSGDGAGSGGGYGVGLVVRGDYSDCGAVMEVVILDGRYRHK